MLETIAIRNPETIRVVSAEMEHGAGRTHTEAAENLIRDAVERRRLDRALGNSKHPCPNCSSVSEPDAGESVASEPQS